jgi:hypothetical protein
MIKFNLTALDFHLKLALSLHVGAQLPQNELESREAVVSLSKYLQ